METWKRILGNSRGGFFVLFVSSFLIVGCSDDKVAEGILPEDPGARVTRLLLHGKPEAAVAVLENLSAEEEQAPWALVSRGEIILLQSDREGVPPQGSALEEAESLFRQALSQDARFYRASIMLGRVLAMQGQIVEGVKLLDKLSASRPDRAETYFELARIYLQVVEMEAAYQAVNLGLAIDPNQAEGQLLLGTILLVMDQPDPGLRALRAALALEPELVGASDLLAKQLLIFAVRSLQQQDFASVLRIVEEVLQLRPDHLAALKLRGEVYFQTKALEQALADFEKCLELDPQDEEVRNSLAKGRIKRGYQMLFLKKREEALALFQSAVALEAPGVDVTVANRIIEEARSQQAEPAHDSSKEARALFEEASALLAAGEGDRACELLEASLALLPENPFALHQLGLALDLVGKQEEAEQKLKAAMDLGEKLGIKLPATFLKLAEIAIKSERFEEGKALLDQHELRFPGEHANPMAISLRRLLLLK